MRKEMTGTAHHQQGNLLPPARISPLVQMADIDKAVSMTTLVARPTMTSDIAMPAWPTIQGTRRNMITPTHVYAHDKRSHTRGIFQSYNGFNNDTNIRDDPTPTNGPHAVKRIST